MSSDLTDTGLIFYAQDGMQVDFKMEVVQNEVHYSSDVGKINMMGLGSVETENGSMLKSQNGNKITIMAPTVLPSSYTLTYPQDNGTAGSFLSNDGTGVLSWTQGGGSPGGGDTMMQYNNGGSFGGLSTLTTDGTDVTLSGGVMKFGTAMTVEESKVTNTQGNMVIEQTSQFSQMQFVLGGDSMIEQFVFKNSSNVPIMNMGGNGFVNVHGYLIAGFADFSFTGGFPRFSLDPSKFTDNSTNASGTQPVWYAASFGQQELDAVNSNVTTTTASTVYIAGDVTEGQNQTIQNNYSLLVGQGKSLFQGTVEANDVQCSDCEVSNLIIANRYETQGNLVLAGDDITSVGTLTFGSVNGGSLPIMFEGVSSLTTLKMPLLNAASDTVLHNDGTGQLAWGAPGTLGPGTSTDNAIVRWNGTDGRQVKNSIPLVTDSGNITNVGGYFGASMVLTGTANAVQHTTTGTAVMNGDDLKGIELLELGTAKTIFISKEGDFPVAVGGFHHLVDNTNYIITNSITMTNGIQFGVNNSLSGSGFSSSLIFGNIVTGFKSLNQNVYISNITIEGGGDNPIGLCDFVNIDYNSSAPFWGREKRCKLLSVNFINFYNLGRIDGFATNNIIDCLIGGTSVLQRPNRGFVCSNGLSLEFNNNKVVLFKGTSVSSTTSLLTIANNNTYDPLGISIGFNAVNIIGNIIHPRDKEIGINVEPLSTTSLGTISGNTFIRTGGLGPLINYTDQAVFNNYNPSEIKNYQVSSNNGVIDSNPVVKIDYNNNTNVTVIPSINTYVDIIPPTDTYDAITLNTHIGVQMLMTNTVPFVVDEIITGSLSGAQARVVDVVSATEYYVIDTTGTFANTEALTGNIAGVGSIAVGVTGMRLKIKYLNKNPRKMSLSFSLQLAQTSGSGIAWEVAYLYNNILRNCTGTIEVLRATRPGTLNVICLQKFEEGDTVSWQIRNLDGTQNCLIRRATLVVGPA